MKCPACNEILLTIEYEEVELDYCSACHGIWLDTDELDLLLGDHTLTAGFLDSGDPKLINNEDIRCCPICDSPMRKLVTGGAKPVVHDACPKGHGTWFDQDELPKVIEQGSDADRHTVVIAWLRTLFPETEVKQPDS